MQRFSRTAIAAAILSSLSSAALAQATNVQLYGLVDMYVARSQMSGTPSTTVVNSGGMTTSYWGIGGTENLGGGNSAVFAIEGFMRADTGEAGRTPGEAMLTRAAYVGLNGDMGQFKIGRLPTPLFQLSGNLNPFGFSTRFSPLMTQLWIAGYGVAVMGDSGWNNAVHYTSPTFGGGFSVVGQVNLGERSGTAVGNDTSAVLRYSSGPLMVAVAAQEVKNGLNQSAAAPSQRTVFAGGSYDFTAAKVFATYDRNKTELTGRRTRMAHVGVAVPQGAGKWMVGWARANERTNVRAPYHRDTISAGYDYNLSVRTDIYAMGVYDKISTSASGTTYATGIRHKF
ncbi:porin [Pseudoduganella ginsengisoli]|uniref:Porin n=1 Tax=Pseudoduganella ginsengisoli TaxID=1462440 RepID=A0A6L6PYX9_9BURK|nr:porin [Pseudoduganella ginsengisoli]MTW02341.1 porin [Pseudoduganella ginsengisoli]